MTYRPIVRPIVIGRKLRPVNGCFDIVNNLRITQGLAQRRRQRFCDVVGRITQKRVAAGEEVGLGKLAAGWGAIVVHR